MDANLAWYTARAAGLVSWFLLAASITWGVLLHTKALGKKAKPRWLLDLHRFLGGLSVIFVVVHMAALLFDKWVGFGVEDLLVPFASTYRPTAVAWGIAAFYLLLAIEVTSLVMKRLPKKLWHAIHLGSYALFVLGTIHLFTAGTDATNPAVLITTGVVIVETLLFVGLRVRGRRHTERPREVGSRPPSPPAASPAVRSNAPVTADPHGDLLTSPVAPAAPAARAETHSKIGRCSEVAIVAGTVPEAWTATLARELGTGWEVVNGYRPSPTLVIVRGADLSLVAEARRAFPTTPLAVVTPTLVDPSTMVALYDTGADRVIDGQSAAVTAGHLRALARRAIVPPTSAVDTGELSPV